MKKMSRIFTVLLVVAMSFTSCETDDLLKFDFDSDFGTDFNIDIPAPAKSLAADGFAFSQTQEIDPLSDADLKKYASKISKVEIKSVTVEIVSINKPVTLSNCVFEVKSGDVAKSWELPSFTANVGSKYELPDAGEKFAFIQQLIKSGQKFTVKYSGTSSANGVQFKLKFKIAAKITASV
jgi:hypothetical protein